MATSNVKNVIKGCDLQEKYFCKRIESFMKDNIVYITSLLLLVLFQNLILFLFNQTILPIVSNVDNNSYIVAILIVLLIVLFYVYRWQSLQLEVTKFCKRHRLYLTALIGFIIIKNNYDWYCVGNTKISYIFLSIITLAIIEIILLIIKYKRTNREDDYKFIPFIYDCKTNDDKYKRRESAEVLAQKILATSKNCNNSGSFNILISERYGDGKTTFLSFLDEKLHELSGQNIRTMTFRPWLCDTPDEIITDFFTQLANILGQYSQIGTLLHKYSSSLSNGSAQLLTRIFTGILEHNKESLSQQHDILTKRLSECAFPIVIYVDDVDRLQSKELLMLLNLIRDTANFPKIFYVVAADRMSLIDLLQTEGISDAEFFLRKFFNFELSFPANDDVILNSIKNQIKILIDNHQIPPKALSDGRIDKTIAEIFRIKYINEVFQNERDVKRFFNLLSYSVDLISKDNILEDVYFVDLFKLTIVQMLRPDIYRLFRDKKRYFLTEQNGSLTFANKDIREGIEDRLSKRSINELIDSLDNSNQQGKSLTNETSDDKDNEVVCSNISATISTYLPNTEDIVYSILYDWFANVKSYAVKTGITFSTEYFKYFAGHYKSTEVSFNECTEILKHSDDEFITDFLNIMYTNKEASFLHKWSCILDNNNSVNRNDMLHKIIIAMEIYSDQEFNKSSRLIGFDYEKIKANSFENIICNLYKKRDGDDLSKSKTELSNILLSNAHYTTDVLILDSLIMSIANYAESMVFGSYSGQYFTNLKKALINKFFCNLRRFPGGTPDMEQIENLKAIRTLMVEDKYDIEQYDLYLKETKHPEDWLYRLVKPYKRGFGWNYDFISAVTSYYNNVELLEYLDKLPQSFDTYLSDLAALKSCLKDRRADVNQATLIQPIPELESYLLNAQKWWDNHQNLKY